MCPAPRDQAPAHFCALWIPIAPRRHGVVSCPGRRLYDGSLKSRNSPRKCICIRTADLPSNDADHRAWQHRQELLAGRMAVSRAAVFSCVARHRGPLQTNVDRDHVGASASSGYDGGVCLFPPPGGHRIGLSASAPPGDCGGSAVAAVLIRTLGIVQQPHWQFQPDFKGLFSAHDYSWSSRCHGARGLSDYALAPRVADGLVPMPCPVGSCCSSQYL